jgi:hypothetical protein
MESPNVHLQVTNDGHSIVEYGIRKKQHNRQDTRILQRKNYPTHRTAVRSPTM